MILITNLMENVSQEELMKSPQSTDTFSTIPSPRKRESLKRKEESLRRQQTEEEEYSRPTGRGPNSNFTIMMNDNGQYWVYKYKIKTITEVTSSFYSCCFLLSIGQQEI